MPKIGSKTTTPDPIKSREEKQEELREANTLSWVDTSVIGEIARRLRSVGLWDNNLGDGIALLEDRIKLLERFTKYEGFNYREIRRPLKTWEDCRKLLTVISASRFKTFSDIPAPINACLSLAVLLYQWENETHLPIPEDIRVMMHGAICVEWSKGFALIIGSGGCSGKLPDPIS